MTVPWVVQTMVRVCRGSVSVITTGRVLAVRPRCVLLGVMEKSVTRQLASACVQTAKQVRAASIIIIIIIIIIIVIIIIIINI